MTQNLEYLNRFKMMLNDNQLSKILHSKIIMFGVGGVGSALCHFLVRSGIQNLAIVDFDYIDITNVNRQLVAYQTNVGKLKVEELSSQLKEINPNLNLTIFPIKYSEETAQQISLGDYDIIVDCIDDIKAKQHLILEANKNNVYILSAMGAGNRFEGIPRFEIADISKTSYDAIAKILRKFCVKNNIKKLEVCYTKQKADKFDCKTIGSVVYYPVNMATIMCSRIIEKIIS